MIARFPKDPNSIEPFHIVWCDRDGTNNGGASDEGELQGATISTSEWTVPSGITKDSDNTDAINIRGVAYAENTVATIWLSGGTAGEIYTLTNRVELSDGRTLDKSIQVRVKEE